MLRLLYALLLLQVLVGLVNRDNMMVIIRRALAQGSHANGGAEIEYEDLNKNFVSAAARSLISEQQLAVLQVAACSPTLIPLCPARWGCSRATVAPQREDALRLGRL